MLLALVAMGLVSCVSDPESMPGRADDGVVLSGRSAAQPYALAGALDIDRVVLDSHESFLMPIGDLGNQTPIYPAARLADRLPRREVCLRLAVAEDGSVFALDDVTGADGCKVQEGVEADFVDSAMHAARTWRFEPAVRCVFANAEEKAAATNTGCAGAREIPQAVSLHYRFVFEQDEGRGAVRLAR
ncbi:MAG: hypothetical protein O9280_05655 [Silanimonas sp.]|nr:hypothetical protein [Silanimonas sp.]